MIKPEYQFLIPCVGCGKKILRDHPQRQYCSKCKALKEKLKQKIKYQKNPGSRKKNSREFALFVVLSLLAHGKKRTRVLLCVKTFIDK